MVKGLLFADAALLIYPHTMLDLVGIALLMALMILFRKLKSSKATMNVQAPSTRGSPRQLA